MFMGPQGIARKLPRSVKTAILVLPVVLNASLTAIALRLPGCRWLGWMRFLLLFVVVRSLRPDAAALSGGLWSACLYVFCTADPALSVDGMGHDVPSITAAFASWARGVRHQRVILFLKTKEETNEMHSSSGIGSCYVGPAGVPA